MKDKMDAFRAYIDDELEMSEIQEFESNLSDVEKSELQNDIFIKKILSESLEELPADYMQNLNKKLELAHSDEAVMQSERYNVSKKRERANFRTLFSKLYEFLSELFAFVRVPRYGISLAVLVLVIAIVPQMGDVVFEKDGVYNSIGNFGEKNATDMISPRTVNKSDMEMNSYEAMPQESGGYEMRTEEMKSEPSFEMNDSGAQAMGIMANEKAAQSPKSKSMDMAKEEQRKSGNVSEKKIIYRCHINVETLDFDAFEGNLNDWITRYGAYIDSKNISSTSVEDEYGQEKRFRSGQIVIRLKSSGFFEALSELRGMDNLVSENLSAEDVSLHYADTKQKKKNLEAREQALLKLMEKAQNMEDILMVDRELSTVREQIERYGDRLLVWDDLVDYSTFTIYVEEVESKKPFIKPVPKGFFEKIGDTFIAAINNLMNFFQNLVILIVYNIFIIVLFFIAVFVLMGILKKKREKKLNSSLQGVEENSGEDKKS